MTCFSSDLLREPRRELGLPGIPKAQGRGGGGRCGLGSAAAGCGVFYVFETLCSSGRSNDGSGGGLTATRRGAAESHSATRRRAPLRQ